MNLKFFPVLGGILTWCMLGVAVCKMEKIQALRLKTSDRSWAETSGKLKFQIQQGSAKCMTIRETFVRPRKNKEYIVHRSDDHKFGTCYNKDFDTTKPLDFRILSDSSDDCYVNSAAVELGGFWRQWNGYQVKIDKSGHGNTWHSVDGPCKGACGKIQRFRIKVSDLKGAETSGKLRFLVKQGEYSCLTDRDTFVKPQRNKVYEQTDVSKFGSCRDVQFHIKLDIAFKVLSDSGDDSYIDSAAVMLGNKWKQWNGYHVKIDKKGAGNEWRTAGGPCTGHCETIKRFRIEVSDRSHAGSSGKLRFEVQQGGISCGTARDTFSSPYRRMVYHQADRSKFGTCNHIKFNLSKAIMFRILSDSTDDSYIDRAAVQLGEQWRQWVGHYVKINKEGAGNEWRSAAKGCYLKKTAVSKCTLVNGIAGACKMHLLDFSFAGAHNAGSGSFGPMRNKAGAKVLGCMENNQDRSITSMLRDYGVRFFDMDVSYISKTVGDYWEKGIILIHKILTGTAYSRPLRWALEEINDWLGCDENRNEIVVIRIKDHPKDKTIMSYITSTLEEEFRVITTTSLNNNPNPILGDAILKNKRLVVYINEDLMGPKLKSFNKLKQVETWRLQGALTKCYKPEELISRLKKDPHASDKTYLIQVDWFYGLGICYKNVAKVCNEKEMLKWIEINNEVHKMYKKPVNSFMIDYVGLEAGNRYLKTVVTTINKENVKRYAIV